jgi:hypothetical protein
MTTISMPGMSSEARRVHCAKALSFWNMRNRHANWIMPRRTRALPERASAFSRRFLPQARSWRSLLEARSATPKMFKFDQINEYLDLLRTGQDWISPVGASSQFRKCLSSMSVHEII